MCKAIAIFAVAILLYSSMSNAILVAGFKLNQVEVERRHCVNKAQPQKQCHGKCHLSKQLAENNRKDDQPTPQSQLLDSFKLNLLHQPSASLQSHEASSEAVQLLIGKTLPLSRLFGNSLFQPPDYQLFNA